MEEVKAGRSRARTWWALAALAIVLALLGLLYLYFTGAISQALPKGIRPPAAAVSPPDNGALFSLTVSPGRIVIPQGPSHQETAFQVSNSGGENLDITVATGELSQRRDGGVVFAPPRPGSAAGWVVASPATFSLKPGESQEVRVIVDIPALPEPGDHQVGLTFLVPVKGASSTVNINRGIGTQVLITVPGPVVHDVQLSGLTAPWFSDGGPVPLSLTVQNRGTVHQDYYQPNGLLGSVNAGTVVFPDFAVLRQTTRTVRGDWTGPPLLCWCTVRVYGDDGNGGIVSASTRVFVFPLRLVIGLLVAAVGLYLARSELRGRRVRRQAEAAAGLAAQLEAARLRGYEDAARARGAKPTDTQPLTPPGTG